VGHRAISFNSCRDRHCPKCQTAGSGTLDRCASARITPPRRYLHVVFHTAKSVGTSGAGRTRRSIYDLLFRTSAETLLEVGRDPRHLGAEIGCSSAYCTPGASSSTFIRMSIVSCPPAGPLTRSSPAGCALTRQLLPSQEKCCAKSFAASSLDAPQGRPFQNGQLNFHADLKLLATAQGPSPPGCDHCFDKTGWCT